MQRRHVIAVLATGLAIASVYAPQPLLPVIAQVYGLPRTETATLITWCLLPMGLAPIVAGLLLQRIAAERLVAACLVLLGLSNGVFALTPSFEMLVGLRLVQGALVAMLLPAVMTVLAALPPEALRRAMAFNVTSSVAGGLFGRLLAGWMASWGPWWLVCLVLGALALGCGLAGWSVRRASAQAAPPPVSLRRLLAVLTEARYVRLFGLIAASFFVFTALLNFIPFRLDELSPGGGADLIALAYGGFVVGGAVALASGRIVSGLGGDVPAMTAAVAALVASLIFLAVPGVWAVGVSVAASAGGFFLLHTVLSAHIHEGRRGDPEAVNSLYLASYYTGGTVGSWLPGLAYDAFGWAELVWLLAAVMAVAVALLVQTARRPAPDAPTFSPDSLRPCVTPSSND